VTGTGEPRGVHPVSTRAAGPAEVTVLPDRRVRWQVRMSGGATSQLSERLQGWFRRLMSGQYSRQSITMARSSLWLVGTSRTSSAGPPR